MGSRDPSMALPGFSAHQGDQSPIPVYRRMNHSLNDSYKQDTENVGVGTPSSQYYHDEVGSAQSRKSRSFHNSKRMHNITESSSGIPVSTKLGKSTLVFNYPTPSRQHIKSLQLDQDKTQSVYNGGHSYRDVSGRLDFTSADIFVNDITRKSAQIDGNMNPNKNVNSINKNYTYSEDTILPSPNIALQMSASSASMDASTSSESAALPFSSPKSRYLLQNRALYKNPLASPTENAVLDVDSGSKGRVSTPMKQKSHLYKADMLNDTSFSMDLSPLRIIKDSTSNINTNTINASNKHVDPWAMELSSYHEEKPNTSEEDRRRLSIDSSNTNNNNTNSSSNHNANRSNIYMTSQDSHEEPSTSAISHSIAKTHDHTNHTNNNTDESSNVYYDSIMYDNRNATLADVHYGHQDEESTKNEEHIIQNEENSLYNEEHLYDVNVDYNEDYLARLTPLNKSIAGSYIDDLDELELEHTEVHDIEEIIQYKPTQSVQIPSLQEKLAKYNSSTTNNIQKNVPSVEPIKALKLHSKLADSLQHQYITSTIKTTSNNSTNNNNNNNNNNTLISPIKLPKKELTSPLSPLVTRKSLLDSYGTPDSNNTHNISTEDVFYSPQVYHQPPRITLPTHNTNTNSNNYVNNNSSRNNSIANSTSSITNNISNNLTNSPFIPRNLNPIHISPSSPITKNVTNPNANPLHVKNHLLQWTVLKPASYMSILSTTMPNTSYLHRYIRIVSNASIPSTILNTTIDECIVNFTNRFEAQAKERNHNKCVCAVLRSINVMQTNQVPTQVLLKTHTAVSTTIAIIVKPTTQCSSLAHCDCQPGIRHACANCTKKCRDCGWEHAIINDPTFIADKLYRHLKTQVGDSIQQVCVVQMLPTNST